MGFIDNKLIFLLFPLLFSCDCYFQEKGIVLDSETKKPVPDARISLGIWETTSNNSGEFEFNIITSRCPDRIIRIQKEGYKDFEIEIQSDDNKYIYSVTTDYGYHEYPESIPSKFNPKIKELGSYFDLYSTRFEALKHDSIVFYLDKKHPGM